MLRRCPLPRPEEFAAMKGGHLAGMKGGHLAGEDGQDTITVAAGQAAWTLRPSPREVAVEDGPADNPRVVIEGAPDPVLRWLWGRAGDDAVQFTGDPPGPITCGECSSVVTQ
jgi:hypothetical protein